MANTTNRGCLAGLAVFLLLAGGFYAAYREGLIRLPPNSVPWQMPDLEHKPGPFTRLQIERLDPPQCLALLTRHGLGFTPLQDRRIDDRCGHFDAVRIERAPIALSARAVASCKLALSLLWFEKEIQPIAAREFGARIVRIDHVGTFACRNVNSTRSGPRSEHATANAIDISGFRLSDGRRISIAGDFGKASPEGRFLDAAHQAGCGVFNTLLGPRYNALHAGHFHADMGPYSTCS